MFDKAPKPRFWQTHVPVAQLVPYIWELTEDSS